MKISCESSRIFQEIEQAYVSRAYMNCRLKLSHSEEHES